ncbi:MAG: hypothetical protein MK138_05990, partial [Planctomycetes bacterium]|nr:hypothetical protein [Planctomycetota bacterium]
MNANLEGENLEGAKL